jgi:hypothetical protein
MPTVTVNGKSITLHLTPRAQTALAARQQPLLAEMELYFSCLIRKRVHFRELGEGAAGEVATEKLHVRFRPVVSRACGAKVADGPPPLAEVDIVHAEAYTPDWLAIDYRDGEWQGSFGYGAR